MESGSAEWKPISAITNNNIQVSCTKIKKA